MALLGLAGCKRRDAEEALRSGKEKLEAFLQETTPTTVTPRNDPYAANEPIPEESEFREFINSLDLKYFSANEILRPHRNYRNGVRNNIPPESLWDNLIPTLKLADRLREELGVKVEVLSIYRSMAYNTAINGASRSQHMQNRAMDLKFNCSSDRAFNHAKKLRKEGVFQGGIGWYNNFIHIDTRGYNATWGKV